MTMDEIPPSPPAPGEELFAEVTQSDLESDCEPPRKRAAHHFPSSSSTKKTTTSTNSLSKNNNTNNTSTNTGKVSSSSSSSSCSSCPLDLPLPLGAPELVYRVLSYLDATGLQTFKAAAEAARDAVCDGQFGLHWRGTLQAGDRLEVWDLKDKKRLWREAVVVSATERCVRVHYQSWGNKWDATLRRSSKRLAPLFTRSVNWRFTLRRKQLVEVTKWGNTSGWWLGVVLNVHRPRPNARWTKADVAVLGFTRVRGEDNTQKAVCLQRSLAEIPPNRVCTVDGFNSEQLSWFGDHLGMSLANFRFNTTFLAELNS